MYSPVLVTPATEGAVTIDEAKMHLRVALPDETGALPETDEDTLIGAFLQAATAHLDGPAGILGRCILSQTWRIDYDRFCRSLLLPLVPVSDIVSVTWRNSAGQISTIDDDEYLTEVDDRGNVYLRFRNAYAFPTDLYDRQAVSVTFKAGYPVDEFPPALKVAILLLVGNWYDNREATVLGSVNELPFAVRALISPFVRMAV